MNITVKIEEPRYNLEIEVHAKDVKLPIELLERLLASMVDLEKEIKAKKP